MAGNFGEGAAFIATGTVTGASVSATVGGMGLVGGFGGIGIGMAPVAVAGGVVGAAAFGAAKAMGEGDATAIGAVGIGTIGGMGFYSAIGGMGLSWGGTAVGIGMGTMAATGGIVGLAAYGIAKLIDKAGTGETPAQAFARMETKVLEMECYASAWMELEAELSGEAWKQKFAAMEIESELKELKAQFCPQCRAYFNFNNANFHQPTFKPFINTRKITAIKVQSSPIWQCFQTLKAHTATVNSIAISSDNHIFASGSDDRTVTLWNLQTGKRIYTFFGQAKEVHAVAISPNSQMLVSGDFDGKITRWNIAKKELIGTCFYLNSPASHAGFIYSLAFSPDGEKFASASADKTIRVWSKNTGNIKLTLNGHTDAVRCVAITPDGNMVVSDSCDRTIRIWDLNTGNTIHILSGHNGWLTSVAISPDGNNIISVSTDTNIKLWHLKTGELIRTFSGHSSAILSVDISFDGNAIASACQDKVHLWNLHTGELLQTFSGRYPVAFSPDGNSLITGGDRGIIKIWHQCFGSKTKSDILLSGEWWEILGVDKNAESDTVKRSYRKLARQYHPDLNNSDPAKANMQAIVAAYQKFRRIENLKSKI